MAWYELSFWFIAWAGTVSLHGERKGLFYEGINHIQYIKLHHHDLITPKAHLLIPPHWAFRFQHIHLEGEEGYKYSVSSIHLLLTSDVSSFSPFQQCTVNLYLELIAQLFSAFENQTFGFLSFDHPFYPPPCSWITLGCKIPWYFPSSLSSLPIPYNYIYLLPSLGNHFSIALTTSSTPTAFLILPGVLEHLFICEILHNIVA